MGTLEDALELARSGREQAESELIELVSIPSISALSRHREDVRSACDWTAGRLRRMGLEVEVAEVLEGGHPVISAEWMGAGAGRPVLAIYGHYDVQPPDPLSEWTTPPFEPVVRNGVLAGRGASDNKGQYLAGLKAAEYAFAAGPPPVNLRFLIEGEEEITGRSLPEFVLSNAGRLRTDYLFIADGQFAAPGLPSLITALRGLLYVEIEAEGAAVDLHSGIYGGVAPNPLNTLAHILSALKGRDGRVTLPGFYDRVRPPSAAELEAWARLPGGEEELLQDMAVAALEGEAEFTPAERRWSRPSLDVHGVVGGFIDEGKKTVIPARAKAKVSFRLVPDQDPTEVLEALEAQVRLLTTPGSGSRCEISGTPPRCWRVSTIPAWRRRREPSRRPSGPGRC